MGVQFQNWVRATKLQKELFETLKLDLAPDALTRSLEMLFGSANHAMADSIRGFIKAPTGKVLAGCDFNQIEARILPWMAGEDDVLANIDQLYELTASSIFHVPPEETRNRFVGAVSYRFLGKTTALACGYGGSVDAIDRMALNFGVKGIDQATKELAVRKFREARPGTCKLWRKMEYTAMKALLNPGAAFTLQMRPALAVHWFVDKMFLCCSLPSGRVLRYAYPKIKISRVTGRDCISYMTVDSQSRKWIRRETWGGKLVQNVDSGTAADILMLGAGQVEQEGHDIVLTIHDEIIAETIPERAHEIGPLFRLEKIERPAWLTDLPIAGDVWVSERYMKA